MAGTPPPNSGSPNPGQTPEQSREENANGNLRSNDLEALFNLITPGAGIADNYTGEWSRSNYLTSGSGVVGRIPLIMTTEVMAQQGRYMVFWASPESVSWNFKMRGTTQDTATGTIQHYYKDPKRNTYFDEPEVQFNFQSGNIMPVRVTQQRDENKPNSSTANTLVYLPFGLLNLYEFFELMDQKKVIADGRTNFVYILYSSLVFPRMILRGFFQPEQGITFNESANDNAEVKWAATFKVVATYPKFNDARSLTNSWRELQERLGYTVDYSKSAFVPLNRAPLGTSGGDT